MSGINGFSQIISGSAHTFVSCAILTDNYPTYQWGLFGDTIVTKQSLFVTQDQSRCDSEFGFEQRGYNK